MKNLFIKFILISALLFLPFGAVKAFDTKTGDSVYVPKDEIISGNLYVAGDTITVDGDIAGDLIAIAQTININGNIEGDIIAATQNITINGRVNGNVRAIGSIITINGLIARNVSIFSKSTTLGSESKVGWDVTAASSIMESHGDIDGGLAGNFGSLLISGKIGKNINVKMSDSILDGILTVTPEATINNNLIYIAEKPAEIAEGAKINGEITQKSPQVSKNISFSDWLWPAIYSIFGALAVGLVFVFLSKDLTPKIIKKIEENPLRCSIYGLTLMITLPLAAILLIFTLIGIPLSLIIFTGWFIIMYVAKIFTAILVGSLILKNINKKNNPKLIWSLILGVVICWLLFAAPYVGWIISLLSVWLGLGGIFIYASNQSKHF